MFTMWPHGEVQQAVAKAQTLLTKIGNLPDSKFAAGEILELIDSAPPAVLPEDVSIKRKDLKTGDEMDNGAARTLVEAFASVAADAETFLDAQSVGGSASTSVVGKK